jgi:hypothetical protein
VITILVAFPVQGNHRLWPISEVASPLIEVRSVGYSGLDVLGLSSSHFDPSPTSPLRQPAMRMPTITLRSQRRKICVAGFANRFALLTR